EAMVFDAVARHRSGVMSLESFKEVIIRESAAAGGPEQEQGRKDFLGVQFCGTLPTLKEAETLLMEEALRRADGNQGIAASLLGISRSALNKRLRKMD
ncbi:MAG: helix-turn-helix domain-containing protein, partial [Geobacteraceae bacterium]|nr:helix-turn-helix domain-containing protein [Geobacteraceae bacterium]